eukprot:TRINITY_DN13418_c0_g1_i1.p1 TRINITY_DN13418_c0_g1~~TRINITY_DN13418_c0_g1_i1.p1  ORF type:complete len:477 (-),score=70.68 TRINITY_DN13418_c0_g1_i1:192-1622(-)
MFRCRLPCSLPLVAAAALGFGSAGAGLVEDLDTPITEPPNQGVGVCLGNCFDCHSLLEALPREPFAAAATHSDPTRASVDAIADFLAAPEVCDIRYLYPVSVDREMWSLAALPGGTEQLNFQGAKASVRLVVETCQSIQQLSVAAWAEALSVAKSCSEVDESDPRHTDCLKKAFGPAFTRLFSQWQSQRLARRSSTGFAFSSQPPAVDELRSWSGNETKDLVEAYGLRAESALMSATSQASARGLLSLPLGGKAAQPLVGLAMELGRLARLLIEHSRTAFGIRNLLSEISSVYPTLKEMLPVFRVHSTIYGRHWDVLERLVHSLSEKDTASGRNKNIRMAELGVACGPIGKFLLDRFPKLEYHGADPTIVADVHAAYDSHKHRARLFAMTSEDMHGQLLNEEPMDFAFIDGPHTYKNVNNDLQLWEPRVRPGGIIAGHDFTCRHPPLLWAVIEHRIKTGGSYINIAIDGVWWWTVE